jgi:hypothetical protein
MRSAPTPQLILVPFIPDRACKSDLDPEFRNASRLQPMPTEGLSEPHS